MMETEPPFSGAASRITPLAFPKGMKKMCELCQRIAHIQCTKCRVTFYCDAEHQRADWVGIHQRICQFLIPIRNPALVCCPETQSKKAELIEICRLVAQSKLSEGKHEEALPAAQFCLSCSIDVHGPRTVQLVPAYLLLAEANMGLSNLVLVSDLLSQAQWYVLKNPDCGLAVHQQLHRSLGRLHAATGNLEASLHDFATDIYYASEEFGLDSTVTCGGYFLMAGVFAKQGKMPIARSLYSQVAHMWHRRLTKLVEDHIQNVDHPDELLDSTYDKAQRVEVDVMLRTVLEIDQKDSSQIALVAHCLAMLWFLGGEYVKALGFGSTALQASQLIPNHDLTEPIRGLLQLVHSVHTDPHPGSV
ncbi:zinc finger MYND domain-containing protein 12 [Embiotoca jacksoni]|uniref:zinc finger MYND domain-containing protein 12 n=1 Tax=Embiotoca jacksoni TaxID=100190 RepID=UPI003704A319